jgi:hypothetical protein
MPAASLGLAAADVTIAIDEVRGGVTTIALNGEATGQGTALLVDDEDGGRYRLEGFAQAHVQLGGREASHVELAGVGRADVATGGGDDAVLVTASALWGDRAGDSLPAIRVSTGEGRDSVIVRGAGVATADVHGGTGDDSLHLAGVLGGRVNPGGGADFAHLGPAHGEVWIVLERGSTQGDVIAGFSGARVHGGDVIELHGYGTGAKLMALGDCVFRVRAADGFAETFTITDVTRLAMHDVVWS